MYFHVIHNVKRNGISGYLKVGTYKTEKAAQNAVEKSGIPIWLFESNFNYLPVNGQHSQPSFGGFETKFWNFGNGWGEQEMPLMPLFFK